MPDGTPLLCTLDHITQPDFYEASSILPQTFTLRTESAVFAEISWRNLRTRLQHMYQVSKLFRPPFDEVLQPPR
jgi:hypothetical protein